jgi:hypothetical protein
MVVKTDENGRAEFSGIAPGTTVKAVANGRRRAARIAGVSVARERRHPLMLVRNAEGGDAPPPVFQPQPGTSCSATRRGSSSNTPTLRCRCTTSSTSGTRARAP